MASWKERSLIVREMPRLALLTFLCGVACLFAGIGTLNDALGLEQSTAAVFVRNVVGAAVLAVGWAWFGARRMLKSLAALALFTFLYIAWTARIRLSSRSLNVAQWRESVLLHSVLALVLVNLGYVCFVTLFRMEGRRFFALRTEIELASAIQRKLVPAIGLQARNFEFYGVSFPSGAVGGDLFDVVQSETAACAYLADVAGHGVPAGVLMSMIKSAVRTRLLSVNPRNDDLLGALNEVLTPLTDPNSYATFAYVLIADDSHLEFSIAGHPPLFHVRERGSSVRRCSVENFPLAMFPGVAFKTAEVECCQGDLIAMISDGLTEIFDKKDNELGADYIGRILLASAARPLPEIAQHIFKFSESFGKVTDDRTLLLMRKI